MAAGTADRIEEAGIPVLIGIPLGPRYGRAECLRQRTPERRDT